MMFCHIYLFLQVLSVSHSQILRMVGSGSLGPRWARRPPTGVTGAMSWLAGAPGNARPAESGVDRSHFARVSFIS